MNQVFEMLRARGWRVELRAPASPLLPAHLAKRYAWLDREVIAFFAQLQTCCSGDETAWFLTAAGFDREAPGFRWNEYELMGVEFAEGDESLRRAIHAFWDDHFPIAMAVHSDHDYLAIRKEDGAVVHGFAPDWTDPDVVASSFAELIEALEKQLLGEVKYPFTLFLGKGG
jgi:hypothetical protein